MLGLAAGAVAGAFRRRGPGLSPFLRSSEATGAGLLGFAFGLRDQDVTVFDAATLQPIARTVIGAAVRWLSNEQTFWDGRFIWTYDFPSNRVQAIAIDPLQPAVAQRIITGGTGPAHSLMLMDDGRTAWVNVAGENYLAVIDTEKGGVVDEVATGQFP